MVYLRRIFKRSQLVLKRLSLVHHDRWDSDRNAVFQICRAQLLSIWKRSDLRRRSGISFIKYFMDDHLRNSAGSGIRPVRHTDVHYDRRNTIGLQHFKIAKLALMPFGAEVY